ncbi:major facilitator superfamily domain-containing protein, partial [Protomyces lactucae-debilis]
MPFPHKRQLLVLAACRLAEPVAFTSVFPYLFDQIRNLHITDDEKKIAKYGGFVSSVFSLGSFLSGLSWGRASDKYGRKPIILLGLLFTILSSLVFGFSRNIYQLVAARFAAGLLNGNVGVIRTVVAELVTEKRYQATAFSIMPIVWSTGTIFGPALGGWLADPVATYPQLFKRSQTLTKLFTRYRYALPNLVTASLLSVSVTLGWLLIEETLITKRGKKDAGLRTKMWISRYCCCCCDTRRRKTHYRLPSANALDDDALHGLMHARPSTSGSHDLEAADAREALESPTKSESHTSENQPPPPLRQLFTRQVTLNILAYSTLSMHTTSFDQIFPMFLATGTSDGGLGMTPQRIGAALSLIGVCSMVLQILVFPPIQRRLGSAWCLRISAGFYALVYLTVPLLQQLAKQSEKTVFGGVLACLFAVKLAGVFSFPSSAILVTNAVREPRLLGSVNGLNQALGAFTRMLGPALFGVVLSLSLEYKLIYLVWSCLALVSAISCVISCFIEEDWYKEPVQSDEEEGHLLLQDEQRHASEETLLDDEERVRHARSLADRKAHDEGLGRKM